MDRIDATIMLGKFDKGNAKVLVEKRLSFNRVAGKFENQPLIPFTEDFIDFVYEKTQGELREIITLCSQVLDAGLEKNVPQLDATFAEKVIEERKLS